MVLLKACDYVASLFSNPFYRGGPYGKKQPQTTSSVTGVQILHPGQVPDESAAQQTPWESQVFDPRRD
jgi:hypothetical protein